MYYYVPHFHSEVISEIETGQNWHKFDWILFITVENEIPHSEQNKKMINNIKLKKVEV